MFDDVPSGWRDSALALYFHLFGEDHARIIEYGSRRFPCLDRDQSDLIADRAHLKYVRYAITQAALGNPEFLDHPERYFGLRLAMARNCALDLIRDMRRRAAEPIGIVDAAKGSAPCDPATPRDLVDVQARARLCERRLPEFFSQLESGKLAPRFREMRRVALRASNATFAEQFVFLEGYLFFTADEGLAHGEITRELDWFAEKARGARDVAIHRRMEALRDRWIEVERIVFANGTYDHGRQARRRARARGVGRVEGAGRRRFLRGPPSFFCKKRFPAPLILQERSCILTRTGRIRNDDTFVERVI